MDSVGYRLLTCAYAEPRAERRAEFVEALSRNKTNACIDVVDVLVEERVRYDEVLKNYGESLHGVCTHLYGERATYDALFTFANARWAPRTRVILANADIYFDETLALLDRYDLTDTLLCLSRWNVRSDGPPVLASSPLSQDAWIFETPIRPIDAPWTMGVLGCDSRLAYRAGAAGLSVWNPCLSVKAWHLHQSGVRNYNTSFFLQNCPSLPVPFVALEDIPKAFLPLRKE